MMVSKAWQTMNELDSVTTKICSAREIIDAAVEAIQHSNYNRAETLATAAYEFLGYYLDEFDKKFQDAWKETVVARKKEESDTYTSVITEKEYCEPSQAEPSKSKSWILPVRCSEVFDADVYYIDLPDDLLSAANLKVGDEIKWIDNKDGTFSLVKK